MKPFYAKIGCAKEIISVRRPPRSLLAVLLRFHAPSVINDMGRDSPWNKGIDTHRQEVPWVRCWLLESLKIVWFENGGLCQLWPFNHIYSDHDCWWNLMVIEEDSIPYNLDASH